MSEIICPWVPRFSPKKDELDPIKISLNFINSSTLIGQYQISKMIENHWFVPLNSWDTHDYLILKVKSLKLQKIFKGTNLLKIFDFGKTLRVLLTVGTIGTVLLLNTRAVPCLRVSPSNWRSEKNAIFDFWVKDNIVAPRFKGISAKMLLVKDEVVIIVSEFKTSQTRLNHSRIRYNLITTVLYNNFSQFSHFWSLWSRGNNPTDNFIHV